MFRILSEIFLNELTDRNADKNTIEALHNAIINHRSVSFDYEDDPDSGPRDGQNRGWRKDLEPVCMGFGHVRSSKNDGELYLRAWQNSGVSKRGITNKDGVNWKLYKLSRIKNINFGTKNFEGPRRFYNPFGDSTIKTIYRFDGVPSIGDFRKEQGVAGDLTRANADVLFKAVKKAGVSKEVDRLDLDLMPDLSIIKNKDEWFKRIKPDLKTKFTANELPSVEKAIEDRLEDRKLKTLKELFEML
jgi:hypothetical protein